MAHISEARNGGNRPSLDSKEDIRTRLDTATDSTSQGFLASQRARLDRLTDDLAGLKPKGGAGGVNMLPMGE